MSHSHKPKASRECFFSLTTSSSTVRRYQSHSPLLDGPVRSSCGGSEAEGWKQLPRENELCTRNSSLPGALCTGDPLLVRPFGPKSGAGGLYRGSPVPQGPEGDPHSLTGAQC